MDFAINNIPREYTIIAEMMSCWVFFFLFKPRKSTVKIILYSIIVIVLEALYLRISKDIQFWFWPVHMLFFVFYHVPVHENYNWPSQ